MGRGVLKVASAFIAAGITDLCVKLYKDARHECHNEINRDEVLSYVVSWSKRISGVQ